MPLGNDRGSNKDLLNAISGGTFTLVTGSVIPNNTDRFTASQVVTYVYVQPISNRTATERPRWDELIAIPQVVSSTVTIADEVGPLQYVAHDLGSGATFTFTTTGSNTTYTASGTLPANKNYDFTVSSIAGIASFGITSQGVVTSVVPANLASYNFATVASGNTYVTAKAVQISVVTTIQGFNGPHYGAYHPGTGNMFIGNIGDRSLKVLNTATSSASLSIPLPSYPGNGTATGSNTRGVIYVPGIDRIWVRDEAGYIYEFNPYLSTFKTFPVVTPSDVSVLSYGYEMLYVSDIDRVFSFLLNSGKIDVINPHNYLITNNILLNQNTAGQTPSGGNVFRVYSGVAPGNGYCYLSSYSNRYAVINLSTLSVVTNLVYLLANSSNFMAGICYYNGADSPDTVLITDTGGNSVYRISGAMNPATAVISKFVVGTSPSGITYSPVRSCFYVGFYLSQGLAVNTYSTGTFTQGVMLAAGLSPVYTIYNPSSGKMYALNYASNTVTVLT